MATILEPKLGPGAVPESSDRSFGLVFAAVFALVAGLPLLHGGTPRWWAGYVAVAFALVALTKPQILWPLNRAWLALGGVLHRVMSMVVMTVIFAVCITPIAWIMRWRGKDVLSLARRPDLSSYWIPRASEPDAETMKRQF